MRDQTIGGDTGNHAVSGSYNKTTTVMKDSHNTRNSIDNGTCTNTEHYDDESKQSDTKRYSGTFDSGSRYSSGDNSNHNNTYTQPHRDEFPSQMNINYRREQYEVNSNYGLPLHPGSPHSPPAAPEPRSGQLPPSPIPFHHSSQSHIVHTSPLQDQRFQPFSLTDDITQQPISAVPNNDQPIQITPQATGLDLRPSTPRSPNNPFTARIQSRSASPAVSERNNNNFSFETPRTEPGLISPLQLPCA
ncbi:hypothetical protein BDQ17DRAFT_1364215 [Cyathus striatus]|nr:hypothetical protein BDQ17DRAFT_1364215 [Cyathus striatus]